MVFFFFFFNDTATTEIYTLSLHDALPISPSFPGLPPASSPVQLWRCAGFIKPATSLAQETAKRSEEHTSELQSLAYLVCRLLLEKKKRHARRTRTQNLTIELTPHRR